MFEISCICSEDNDIVWVVEEERAECCLRDKFLIFIRFYTAYVFISQVVWTVLVCRPVFSSTIQTISLSSEQLPEISNNQHIAETLDLRGENTNFDLFRLKNDGWQPPAL